MCFANNCLMPRGRPQRSQRSDFAERVKELRIAVGLSQQEVAQQLGIGQPSYADWERRNVAISAEQVRRLAAILAVPVEDLFKASGEKAKRGPTGRAKQIMARVSQLPRARQKRILDLVESLVDASEEKAS